MDRFIARENIERYRLQLETEQEQRFSLQRKLIEEEDRFGTLARRMDLADAYIDDGARRIATLELLVTSLSRDDGSAHRHVSNLATSKEILEIFKSYRALPGGPGL